MRSAQKKTCQQRETEGKKVHCAKKERKEERWGFVIPSALRREISSDARPGKKADQPD